MSFEGNVQPLLAATMPRTSPNQKDCAVLFRAAESTCSPIAYSCSSLSSSFSEGPLDVRNFDQDHYSNFVQQTADGKRHRLKCMLLRRTIKSLVVKNAALCDEVTRLNYAIEQANDDRKFLVKKLLLAEKRDRQLKQRVSKSNGRLKQKRLILKLAGHTVLDAPTAVAATKPKSSSGDATTTDSNNVAVPSTS